MHQLTKTTQFLTVKQNSGYNRHGSTSPGLERSAALDRLEHASNDPEFAEQLFGSPASDRSPQASLTSFLRVSSGSANSRSPSLSPRNNVSSPRSSLSRSPTAAAAVGLAPRGRSPGGLTPSPSFLNKYANYHMQCVHNMCLFGQPIDLF